MRREMMQLAVIYGQMGCPAPVVLITIGIYILVLVYCTVAVLTVHQSVQMVVTNAAVVLVACACIVSAVTIFSHVRNWHRAAVQVYMVRMVLMVHIYSIESILAVTRSHASTALIWETLRETYEAYVIYCFLRYLITGMALSNMPYDRPARPKSEEYDLSLLAMLRKKSESVPVVEHMAGLRCCVKPWMTGEEFLVKTKLGTMSYVWARVACTAATLVLVPTGHYHEGALFNPTGGYFWCTLVLTCSQSWALYVLVLFYQVMHSELQPLRPLGKFVSIKAIVFFPFWQNMLLVLLVQVGAVPDEGDGSNGFTSRQLQDLLICFEMLLAATAMHLAFAADTPAAAAVTASTQRNGCWCWWDWFSFSAQISADVFSPNDVIRESEETAGLLTAQIQVSGEVELSISSRVHEGKLVKLVVHVAQGRNLAAGDMGGVSDPYALIQLQGIHGADIEGSERKTQVVDKTLNPQWDCWVNYDVKEVPLGPY